MATLSSFHSREIDILMEIKESEKRADEIVEKAKKDKESIIQEATRNATKLIADKELEIKNIKEKKISDFRDKLRLLKEDKMSEGKRDAKQLKLKSEKNVSKAVNLVLEKFNELT